MTPSQSALSAPPAPEQSNPKHDVVISVRRALSIMELLAENPGGLNVKHISHSLKLNLSTCYHLLNTLVSFGYAVKDPETLLFRLSGKVSFTLFVPFSPGHLVQLLAPHVQALHEATRETTLLSLWNEPEIYLAAIIESSLPVRVKSPAVGYADANHALASGKAILAYLTNPELDGFLACHELRAFTRNTVTSPSLLKERLAAVCRQGYSLDIEEFLNDVCSISAPIFDSRPRVVASLAIALPGTRYHDLAGSLIPHVKEAAQAATRTLEILAYAQPQDGRHGVPQPSR